jgi:chemotaxis protein CheD
MLDKITQQLYKLRGKMVDSANAPVKHNYFLQSGFVYVPAKATDISTVLGSCVAVCLYEKKRRTGGMNHFQLPFISEKNQTTARYGNAATYALINMMLNDGSKIKHMEAQILGGAYNLKFSVKNIGRDNIKIARRILAKKKIRVVSEDVGGEKGRKIVFSTHSGDIAVMKVDKLRKSDWYPYQSDR